MNRAVLLSLIAAAAAIALWIVLGGDGRPPAAPADEVAEPAPDPAEPELGRSSGLRERPELRVAEQGDDAGGGQGTRVYRAEGRIVRDHRANPGAAPTKPLSRPPREKLDPMARATLGRVRLGVRPAVKQCARDHADSFAADARLQVVLYVDVAKGVATASGLELQGDAGQQVESCVRGALAGLRIDVPGAPDRSGYPMTLPFDLGPLRE